MRIVTITCLIITFCLTPLWAAQARTSPPRWTDWGGGYSRGPDSASVTVATSGAGVAKPAPVVVPPAPVTVPLTDWGGGYKRGPDSASTTVATSGAGAPKPNN